MSLSRRTEQSVGPTKRASDVAPQSEGDFGQDDQTKRNVLLRKAIDSLRPDQRPILFARLRVSPVTRTLTATTNRLKQVEAQIERAKRRVLEIFGQLNPADCRQPSSKNASGKGVPTPGPVTRDSRSR